MEHEQLVCLGCGSTIDDDGDCPTCEADEAARARASQPPEPRTGLDAPVLRCGACGGHVEPGATRCRFCQATVSTTRCGACLGWNLGSAKHCGWCGDALASRPAGKSSFPCPRCSSEVMRSARFRELEADECDRCGGLFLASAMLDRLVSQRDHAARLHLALPVRPRHVESVVRYLACPVCQKGMNRKQFGRVSGVVVDACKDHGVWFDGGELQAVLDFVSRGGLERARQKDLDDLRAERRKLDGERTELARESARLDAKLTMRGTGQASIVGWLADLWLR